MKVFRIESKEFKGPYSGTTSYIKHNRWSKRSDRIRPGPSEDGIENLYNDDFFGFESLEQLTKWFTKQDRKSFSKNGMYLSVYNVSEKYVKKGTKQVAFKIDKATLQQTLDPFKLVELSETHKLRKEYIQMMRNK